MSTSDTKLVERSNAGDREAFAEIVEKYQSLICSIAYAITGSFSSSEELAQETFVSAWQSLPELREPSRLKQWLSGISRNLSRNRVRRHQHDVLQAATAIETQSSRDNQVEDPVAMSIAQEEIDLLDGVIAELPEQFREPIVLYYREEESVARVAELLELSPDAVKQRLSRGRKLLREEVAAKVERGLRRTLPTHAFTLGVLAALPVMSSTAQAATLTATTVTTAKGASTASAIGLTGAVLGPIAGLLGGWLGYSMSMKSARSDRERAFLKLLTLWALGLVFVFSIGLSLIIVVNREVVGSHPKAFAWCIFIFIFTYVVTLLGTILWGNRRIAQIRREDGTVDDPTGKYVQQLPQVVQTLQASRVFESKARLLGLPLLSIQVHGPDAIGRKKTPALGWFAFGDIAYGVLFASGNFSVGGISVGAVSVGLISFGGLAIGGLALGGLAIGGWSLGGFALGYLAFGGMTMAWQAALGGAAIAHNIAIGGVAVAEHMNDEVAKAYVEQSSFFALGESMMTPWAWWIVVAVCMAPMFIAMRFVSSRKMDSPLK